MARSFVISKDQTDRRLDRLLRTTWPQVPLGAIMKAIRKGEVRLDGVRAAPDTRVKEGQTLLVPWTDVPPTSEASLTAGPDRRGSLITVYRDDQVWIINKRAGLLTQPDTKGGDSLITRVIEEIRPAAGGFRPSTVQRLDRNTSGAVTIALTGPSLRCLSELIRERRIKKIYRVVVGGEIDAEGEINLSLLKDPSKNIVMADARGQEALTKYKRLSCTGGLSAVEAELVTGRPHQARAHFAAIGHPILGDRKYGGRECGGRRPLLHAYSLTFPDDARLSDGVRGRTFFAPLPNDMEGYFR